MSVVDKGMGKWGPVDVVGGSVKWCSVLGSNLATSIHENVKFKYPLIGFNCRNLSHIYLVKNIKMYVLDSTVCAIIRKKTEAMYNVH